MNVTVESLDHEGRGIAHVEGKVIFIEGALPGEKVTYSVFKKKPSYEMATIKEVVLASFMRVTPKCPHFGVCGGCSLQHQEESAQMAAKQRVGPRHHRARGFRALLPRADEYVGAAGAVPAGAVDLRQPGQRTVGGRARQVFVVGRAIYAVSYIRDPKSRSAGFLVTALPTLAMLAGILVWAIGALRQGV